MATFCLLCTNEKLFCTVHRVYVLQTTSELTTANMYTGRGVVKEQLDYGDCLFMESLYVL